TPLIDAQQRYLKRDETVEDYFQDKMRLLRQTKLSDEEMVQQLTHGTPISWRMSLAAARPADPHAWIEVAQQIEACQKAQFRRQSTIKSH
ncbi:unnamed protein product, partial [Sphagnum jensenii]